MRLGWEKSHSYEIGCKLRKKTEGRRIAGGGENLVGIGGSQTRAIAGVGAAVSEPVSSGR